ncbi:hypothetical protein N8H41_02170 [Pseudomonas vlassakiae]|uniref:hypothetical protein n=1 Tax=Pseudomonas TaxID=286 RepID=UPI0006D3F8D3|nr:MULTISPECIES: hypothetical protein [Pseudomonas]AXQ48400.1 hypothetical protein DZC31_14960 [Stenotrophomonas rhizophila]MBS3185506.1 hypothetical protein [Pseudomonas sp. PCH44]MCU0122781.1 hypothetical protein [Pseudomonas vlassakiae]PIK80536.1 hypothetical protein CQW31_02370 [Pseudomonas sp. 382]
MSMKLRRGVRRASAMARAAGKGSAFSGLDPTCAVVFAAIFAANTRKPSLNAPELNHPSLMQGFQPVE